MWDRNRRKGALLFRLRAPHQTGGSHGEPLRVTQAGAGHGEQEDRGSVRGLRALSGLYTLLLSRLVGKCGTVTAIEPDPCNFELLKTNCAFNSVTNVVLHHRSEERRVGHDVRLW